MNSFYNWVRSNGGLVSPDLCNRIDVMLDEDNPFCFLDIRSEPDDTKTLMTVLSVYLMNKRSGNIGTFVDGTKQVASLGNDVVSLCRDRGFPLEIDGRYCLFKSNSVSNPEYTDYHWYRSFSGHDALMGVSIDWMIIDTSIYQKLVDINIDRYYNYAVDYLSAIYTRRQPNSKVIFICSQEEVPKYVHDSVNLFEKVLVGY